MIAVIGAGPAGSYYASKADRDIQLFEEHKEVGRPVACTGILTSSINDIMKVPDEVIISRIDSYKISSPDKSAITVRLKKPDILLDRAGFDRMLFEKAVENGAKTNLGERFLGYKKIGKGYIVKTTRKTYNAEMIVGADGPNSIVGKSSGLIRNRQFVVGLQARCRYNRTPGRVETRLGSKQFSWIVPEDKKIARIGLVGEAKGLNNDFRRLIGKNRIIEYQSGLIPVYDTHQKIQKPHEKIFLIGDAAGHVKATTYGGIIYGLHAADYLAKDPESYEYRFKRDFNKELWLSLRIRRALDSMSSQEADKLIKIFSEKGNMKILEEGSREYPSKMILKLITREPRLIGIGLRILKKTLLH